MLPHARLAFNLSGKSCAAAPALSRSSSDDPHRQPQATGSLSGSFILVRRQIISNGMRHFVNQWRGIRGSRFNAQCGRFKESTFLRPQVQQACTMLTSTRRHQRSPLPYERAPAKSQASSNEEQLMFDSSDGLHDTFDFGPAEELQDLNEPKPIPSMPPPVTKSIPRRSANIPQPPSDIQPKVKLQSTTKTKHAPRMIERRPPLPQEYIVIFQEAKKLQTKTQEEQIPSFREKMISDAKERNIKLAITAGATMPSIFAADRRPYLTPHDLRLREAWSQYAIDYGHKESARRVEELANLGEKRPAPSPSRYWLRKLEEATDETEGGWSALYGKDAAPFVNVENSLQNISEEIGRLYIDDDMESCKPYLRDLQMELQLHMQSVEECMHSYRLAVRQEGQALRLVERAISNYDDLFDAYSISKSLLREPWENYKRSQSDVWRATRLLRTFREGLVSRSSTKKARKRHENYEYHLTNVLNTAAEIAEHYEQSLKRFCHQFANAGERDSAMEIRRSCSSIRINIRSLEEVQTREGILPKMCDQGPESSWSYRQMIYLIGKVVSTDCNQMAKRMSEYETLMLTFRQGSEVLEKISSFYKPDFVHFLARSKERVSRYGEAFLRELYQAQRFETEVDRLIDCCRSDLVCLESQYPFIPGFETLVDSTQPDNNNRFQDRSLKEEGLLLANHDEGPKFQEPPGEDAPPFIPSNMSDHAAVDLTSALLDIAKDIDQLAHELGSIFPGSRNRSAASAPSTAQELQEGTEPTKPKRSKKTKLRISHHPSTYPESSDASGVVVPMPDLPVPSSDDLGNAIPPATLAGLNFQTAQKLAYPELSLSSFVIQPEPFYLTTDGSRTSQDRPRPYDEPGIDPSNPPNSRQHPILEEEPFQTPLGFHIPSEMMKAALEAPENSEQSYWQHSLYRGANGKYHTVKIHYCKNKETMETVSQLFADEEVLGFDIEWIAQAKAKDDVRRNVSLIQLASEERIALFHIARFPGANSPENFVAPTFRRIMESPNISKVGVAIKGDSTRLRNYLGIHSLGLFELSHLYKVLRHCYGQPVRMNRICVSLALQVKEHLHLPLLKGDVQTSDWSRELDSKQVKYAASDSYAGLQLFHRMEAKRLALDPAPPRPAHAELNQALLVTDEQEGAMIDDFSEESDDSFTSFSDPEDSVDETAALTCDLLNLNITNSTSRQPEGATKVKEIRPSEGAIQETSAPPAKSAVPRSRQLDEANEWAASYKITHPDGFQLSPAYLRTYHLWHYQQYDIDELVHILRDPPLRITTVIEYICEAVYRGPLPADPAQFAKMGAFDAQPYKEYHRRMLQAAVGEVERRKTLNVEEAAKGGDVGWWRTTKS